MITPDTAQQTASNPNVSAWVAASAGSGKTTVLSDRVLRLLLNGALPEKILCLTFTKTAAAEMSNRVAFRLSEWATAGDDALANELERLNGQKPTAALIKKARRLFAELLETAGGVKIMTIHAFAQSLLKRFPLEAGVLPHFEIIDDVKSGELTRLSREEVFNDDSFKPELERITELTSATTFTDLMTDINGYLPLLNRLKETFGDEDSLKRAYMKIFGLPESATPETITRDFCTPSADLCEELRQAASALLKSSNVTDTERGATIAAFLQANVRERVDLCQKYRMAFLKKDGAILADRTLATKQCADFLPLLRKEAERVYNYYSNLYAVELIENSLLLAKIGTEIATRYTRKKQAAAVLDLLITSTVSRL